MSSSLVSMTQRAQTRGAAAARSTGAGISVGLGIVDVTGTVEGRYTISAVRAMFNGRGHVRERTEIRNVDENGAPRPLKHEQAARSNSRRPRVADRFDEMPDAARAAGSDH